MVLYAPLTLTALTEFVPEEFQAQIDLQHYSLLLN
ncbi:hypothetical protein U27_00236 [Candidatus Vecturithrix granuli]|uniref:Uncharacterized protein n=1 Tax=Vecturithrix granuli TaxID=1499967 RepID=A0A081C6Z0_VECG1|nr:hypothetical protein U27_00236 [Candidatus Vecturithrix granuli]